MTYVIDPPARPSLAIDGSEARFPIRRIFCVGRNYTDHIRELGNDTRDPPLFFCKPADAVVPSGAMIPYPQATEDVHHEVELVVALARGGRDVSALQAAEMIWGACVGIDLTRRDIQTVAKAKGRPWDMAKGFDNSAPMGALRQMPVVLNAGGITLSVDGETRQSGDLGEMIWSVPDCLAHLSTLVELAPGDVIMTGTPAGVGPVERRQGMAARIDGLPDLEVSFGS